jgi:hypothetical protein
MRYLRAVPAVLAVLCVLSPACSQDSKGNDDMDSGTDTDTDTDTDSNTGTDSDSGSDMDTDSDTDTDNDTDTDTDSDTDTDTDTDSDTDTDTDTETLLPPYCQMLSPVNSLDLGWTGRFAMNDDHVVWRWIDESVSPSEDVLTIKTLSSGIQWELLRSAYPNVVDRPSVAGMNACFDRYSSSAPGLFRIGLTDTEETIVATSDYTESNCAAGESGALYKIGGADSHGGLRFTNYTTLDTTSVIEGTGITIMDIMFDGVRWVAFTELSGDEYLYKFDLENTGVGSQLIQADPVQVEGADINDLTQDLITGAFVPGETDNLDLVRWDLDTNARSVLLSEPWDQLLPDTSGYAVVYLDSNPAGEYWFSAYHCDVRVIDIETGVVRTVLPLDAYFGPSIWSHYIVANNYGMWGDSLVLCDLEEGGIMDSSGHIIPEGGSDAGVDGGK